MKKIEKNELPISPFKKKVLKFLKIISLGLIILVALSFYGKRYFYKSAPKQAPQISQKAPTNEYDLIQKVKSNHQASEPITTSNISEEHFEQLSHRLDILTGIDLLKASLQNQIEFEKVKNFLLSSPSPEIKEIESQIHTIQNLIPLETIIINFLQKLNQTLPISEETSSDLIIKQWFDSLIEIKKLDEKKDDLPIVPEILEALQKENIHKVLLLLEQLPQDKQEPLLSWKNNLLDYLKVKEALVKLLTLLAEGKK